MTSPVHNDPNVQNIIPSEPGDDNNSSHSPRTGDTNFGPPEQNDVEHNNQPVQKQKQQEQPLSQVQLQQHNEQHPSHVQQQQQQHEQSPLQVHPQEDDDQQAQASEKHDKKKNKKRKKNPVPPAQNLHFNRSRSTKTRNSQKETAVSADKASSGDGTRDSKREELPSNTTTSEVATHFYSRLLFLCDLSTKLTTILFCFISEKRRVMDDAEEVTVHTEKTSKAVGM
jgi:hypothetical protein